jgi:hypothetical protein
VRDRVAFWRLRKLMEAGKLAWTVSGAGRVQIEAKGNIKRKLGGASPDYADALAMAVTDDSMPTFHLPLTGPIAGI